MSTLLTNTITVRGVAYEVREINGRTMREVRKRIKDQPETVEAFLAWACTVEPKFASESVAADEPHLVLKSISEEAFRLSTPVPPAPPEEGDAKNA
jgi:hypothetical protein